ncbi:MAG: molybdopterin-guanine dinucleotide biosynthesis protein B [Oscillospiraceae bacterium]|nr:molybdopterin-guanine dinucleotide biosynthesis protein B [Oscillospiraceae bacterium]
MQSAHSLGAVILAGGKSRRMGENKAFLPLQGKPMVAHVADQLAEMDEVLLSVDYPDAYTGLGLDIIPDLYPDCGPINGILSALRVSRSDYLLAVSCDAPLFRKELAQYMAGWLDEHYDIFILVTRDGRMQPLCAIYGRGVCNVFEAQIKTGNYKIIDAFDKLRVRYVPLAHSAFPDEMLRGVNTPRAYAELVRRVDGPPVVAICGLKNAGKTTLLAGVIPLLKAQGLRVAAIKHDGHDFDPDIPGTDSDRLRRAGAFGVGVYSPRRYMATATQPETTPDFFTPLFSRADLILLEGGKDLRYPKIEVVRTGKPASDPNTLLAVATDLDLHIPGKPALSPSDWDGLARIILDHLNRQQIANTFQPLLHE